MKEIGLRGKGMEKELLHLITEIYIKGIGVIMKNMGMVIIKLMMELNMKDSFSKEFRVERAKLNLFPETFMKVS